MSSTIQPRFLMMSVNSRIKMLCMTEIPKQGWNDFA